MTPLPKRFALVETGGIGWIDVYTPEQMFAYGKAERKRVLEPLLNLLAIIHRDGGHHTSEVGIEQSVKDAHEVWGQLRLAAEAKSGYDLNNPYRPTQPGKSGAKPQGPPNVWI